MSDHARLSPSNHRWPNCPGSIREEARYPDIAGTAAIDGTGSHLLLEMCLAAGVNPMTYDGSIIGVNHPDCPGGWNIGPERCARVQMALDYIVRRKRELSEQYPGCAVTVESEGRSDPGALVGRSDWWGTCDITITVVWKDEVVFIEVADYKDGRGWVHVSDNSQLRSYAGGKMQPYLKVDFKPEFRMTIIQPKTNPVIRSQDATYAELMDAVVNLDTCAKKTDDPAAPLNPGKHCQWCKANPKRGGHCTAAAQESMEEMKKMTSDVKIEGGSTLFEAIEQSFGDIKTLGEEQLADLADLKDSLLAQFSRVDTEIIRRIETGLNVPGYIMAPGRASRKWNVSDKEVEVVLKGRRLKKADIYPASIISPAAMEKLGSLTDDQKKRIIDQYVTSVPGKLGLKKVARQVADPVVDFSEEVAKEAATVPSFI